MNLWLRYRYDRNESLSTNISYENESVVDRIRQRDVLGERIVLYGSSIIKTKTIEAASEIVNVHFGLLPSYRGCKGEVWMLADGKVPAVSLHRVTTEIDGGRVLYTSSPDLSMCNTITDVKIACLKEVPKLVNLWLIGSPAVPKIGGRNIYRSTPDWKTILRAHKNIEQLQGGKEDG
jgi:hypothetical protein